MLHAYVGTTHAATYMHMYMQLHTCTCTYMLQHMHVHVAVMYVYKVTTYMHIYMLQHVCNMDVAAMYMLQHMHVRSCNVHVTTYMYMLQHMHVRSCNVHVTTYMYMLQHMHVGTYNTCVQLPLQKKILWEGHEDVTPITWAGQCTPHIFDGSQNRIQHIPLCPLLPGFTPMQKPPPTSNPFGLVFTSQQGPVASDPISLVVLREEKRNGRSEDTHSRLQCVCVWVEMGQYQRD